MIDLDDPEVLAAGDPSGMLGAIESAAVQWRDGEVAARSADLTAEGVRSVVVCGMGGSGMAGDVLAAAAAPAALVPVSVVKGYALPAHVGTDTLVLCVSYSGNTEETMSCFDVARARGARLVVVACGGALADRAADAGAPRISPVAGLQPRAALPSLAAIVINVCAGAGILDARSLGDPSSAILSAAAALASDVPAERNPAKAIALALDGFLPWVWGQDGPLAVAAARWRCQLNENAKLPAVSASLPELDHNEIVGYDPGLDLLRRAAIVVLRSPGEHPRIVRRIEATLDSVRPRVGGVVEARTQGRTPLEVLLWAVLLGDFASVYLALLRGVDPTPVEAIEGLKRRLA